MEKSKRDEAKRGKCIAENIRKVLLNCDLRLIYAEGERNLANEEFLLLSKVAKTKADKKKALLAKARRECYARFSENVRQVKADVSNGLELVLSRYEPKRKQIWLMHFIERRSREEICSQVGYSRENIDKIIQRFKLDMAYAYGPEEETK